MLLKRVAPILFAKRSIPLKKFDEEQEIFLLHFLQTPVSALLFQKQNFCKSLKEFKFKNNGSISNLH